MYVCVIVDGGEKGSKRLNFDENERVGQIDDPGKDI